MMEEAGVIAESLRLITNLCQHSHVPDGCGAVLQFWNMNILDQFSHGSPHFFK